MATLFPFDQYWWAYGLFLLFVAGMLALDLGVFHRKAHKVAFREALVWSVVWVALALAFNAAFYLYTLRKLQADPSAALALGLTAEQAARQAGLEFLTGYLVEKALAVDNLFVFLVVFTYFAIPDRLQHRVLFYGILGALLFRAVFIAMGSVLVQYHAVVVLFGVFLIFTGVKMIWIADKKIEPERNPLIRLLRRAMPVTPALEGQKFFVRRAGVLHATPLFVALVFVEFSDILFAVDSVPAIFAITKEPFIVFTSNVFAILGLRAMYFMLADVVGRFHLLKYGLSAVLVFIGLKMVWLNQAFGGKFPIHWSLGFIALAIGGSIAASLLAPRPPGPPPVLAAKPE